MAASPDTITEGLAIRLLVKSTPSFAGRFEELRAQWLEEIEDRDFIANGPTATALALHLIQCFEAGDTSPLARISRALDRVLTNGTQEARALAIGGVLGELKDTPATTPAGHPKTCTRTWARSRSAPGPTATTTGSPTTTYRSASGSSSQSSPDSSSGSRCGWADPQVTPCRTTAESAEG
jgi:hypothetical protein